VQASQAELELDNSLVSSVSRVDICSFSAAKSPVDNSCDGGARALWLDPRRDEKVEGG